MKLNCIMGVSIIGAVTPLAGVWIEILVPFRLLPADIVTPLAGVWIEIVIRAYTYLLSLVTPLAGVWIEIE